MSRIGKKPISLPSGINLKVQGDVLTAKGPKGELHLTLPASTKLDLTDSTQVVINRTGDHKQARANHGLCRALVSNLIQGVAKGFEKRLEIYGTGYNCKLVAGNLHLNVGYSGLNTGGGAQFELSIPAGLTITVEAPQAKSDTEPAKILIQGCDRQQVGQFAAMLRALRKTEPYKGKGIRYQGEKVVRKQGKALAG